MWFFFQFIAVLILAETLANPRDDNKGRLTNLNSTTIFRSKECSYKYIKDLGKGFTSIVVEAEVIGHPDVHKAIKIIDNRKDCIEFAEQEIEALSALAPHSSEHFIIKMDDSFNYNGHECFALEKLDQSLDDLLKCKNVKLSFEEKSRFAYQLCVAGKFIHDERIVHNDIKLDNVMLARGNSEVRLSDFGIAESFRLSAKKDAKLKDAKLKDAELKDAELEDAKKRDVVTIGSTILKIFDYSAPFIDWDSSDQDDFNVSLKAIHKMGPKYEDLHDFLEKMMKFKPRERMTLDKALEHPFLKKIHHENQFLQFLEKERKEIDD